MMMSQNDVLTCTESDRKALEFIEHVTIHADQVQAQLLSEILSRNADTEYLKRYGLHKSTDRESFKELLPVITYEDLQPDILRIANGDKSPILSSHPISEFLTSSGTSGGERKLMPTIEEDLDRRTLLYSLLMPVMNQYMKGLEKGKGMYFLFIKSETKTPSGLVARPVLTSYYKSRHFREKPYDLMQTSPMEAILCPDAYQSMYVQLLCGLAQHKQVLRAGAVFASGLLRAIRFLEQNWKSLCRDIRRGSMSEEHVRDGCLREGVMKMNILAPNAELAELMERECSRESWEGIIGRLWPNAKYLDVIVTGAMAQYVPTLDFYTGGLPLVCTMYASSECYFGLNLRPLCKPTEVSYTLLPNMAYFEFLPVCRYADVALPSNRCPPLVDLADVELGKEYELVITTYSGLYRYRVGDVLRVSGFHNAAPQFHFVCRKNVMLSIDSDKTDEVELHNAVKKAAEHLQAYGATVMEYTSYADVSNIPGHYVLFWELRHAREAAVPAHVLQQCCLSVEESLNSVYRQGRAADKSIGPLEIKVVESGSFEEVMDYAISRGASINQYKAPRCVKCAPIVELLNCRVMATYFSPKCPTWTPARTNWEPLPKSL